jgi:hypothetical protein
MEPMRLHGNDMSLLLILLIKDSLSNKPNIRIPFLTFGECAWFQIQYVYPSLSNILKSP